MTRILLIEDFPGDAELIRETLPRVPNENDVDPMDRLAPVLTRVPSEDYDVILCDLSLQDGVELDMFQRVRKQFPDLPIVFLVDINEESQPLLTGRSREKVLVTDMDLNTDLLRRTISYAVERQRAIADLLDAGHRDDLTGLLNRTGFLELAEQEMRHANRANRALVLMLCDVSCSKQTDDPQGNESSDIVLREAAEVLRTTFRKSDVLARIDDEAFVVLSPEENADRVRILETKLHANIEALNRQNGLSKTLSMTSETVEIHSGSIGSLLAVLGTADHRIDADQPAACAEDSSFDLGSPSLNP
jgi:two-component system cell cycle response regulator